MNIENLEILIKNGESKTIEFKKSSANLKSAAETLCGFLNEKGGSVFLGVSDSQKIVGQHVTDQTKLEIANILKKFEPTANISVDYVDVGYDKTVVILTAYPDQRCIPYCFDGRSYERKESETHVMSQNRYQQLLLLRSLNPYSWESQVAIGVSIEDLDDQEIVQTMKDMRNKKRINDVTHNDVIYLRHEVAL